MAAMAENVESGASVVMTAPFLREFTDRAWLERVKEKCDDLGAQLNVVWVACDAESMRGYIKYRDARRDDWKLANWDTYLASINLDFRPDFPHVVVDNSRGYGRTLQDQVKELISGITGVSR
jgi:predicted kinase